MRKIKRIIAKSIVKSKRAKQKRQEKELLKLKRQETKALREAQRQIELAEAREKAREAKAKQLSATQKAKGTQKSGFTLLKSDAKKLVISANKLLDKLSDDKPKRKKNVKKTSSRK